MNLQDMIQQPMDFNMGIIAHNVNSRPENNRTVKSSVNVRKNSTLQISVDGQNSLNENEEPSGNSFVDGIMSSNSLFKRGFTNNFSTSLFDDKQTNNKTVEKNTKTTQQKPAGLSNNSNNSNNKYNKINKTEKIIYNMEFKKEPVEKGQIDSKVISLSTSSNKTTGNILFNNVRRVNNVEKVSKNSNDVVENEEIKDVNEEIKREEKKVSNSEKIVRTQFLNTNPLQEEEVKKDDGEVLPRISVFATQKRTEAVRRNVTSNARPSQTSKPIPRNSKKFNGVFMEIPINETLQSDKKPVNAKKEESSNTVSNENDNVFFGTMLINHRKKK